MGLDLKLSPDYSTPERSLLKLANISLIFNSLDSAGLRSLWSFLDAGELAAQLRQIANGIDPDGGR